MSTTITKTTHNVTAYYELDGSLNSNEFELNGETLQEMTQDALEFWQGAPESQGDFEIINETATEDGAEIIIQGTVTNTRGGGVEITTVTLHIEAEEK